MKLAAFLQARMQSQRLPGKSLAPVAGKPLLEYVLRRLESCRSLSRLVVTTSDQPADDAIEHFCRTAKVACYRGPQEDVAARLLGAARKGGEEAFVRLCADSPYYDSRVVDQVVAAWDDSRDVVTNLMPRSFPKGQSVEIVRTAVLTSIYPELESAGEKENPFLFFYRQPSRFRILNVSSGGNFAGMNHCVDTAQDLERFRAFIERLDRPYENYGWQDVTAALEDLCSNR